MKLFCSCCLLELKYTGLSTEAKRLPSVCCTLLVSTRLSLGFFLKCLVLFPFLLFYLSLFVMILVHQIKPVWNFLNSMQSTEALHSFTYGHKMWKYVQPMKLNSLWWPIVPFFTISWLHSCVIVYFSSNAVILWDIIQGRTPVTNVSFRVVKSNRKWIKISQAKTQTHVTTICCLRRCRREQMFVVPVSTQMDLYMGHMACLATPSLYLLPWK